MYVCKLLCAHALYDYSKAHQAQQLAMDGVIQKSIVLQPIYREVAVRKQEESTCVCMHVYG